MENSKNLNRIKMDSNIQHHFLALLRAILQGEPCHNDKRAWNWDEILTLAQSHQIFPLIFEEASHYPEFLNSPNYHSHQIRAMKQIASQIIRTENFLELYRAFLNEELHPFVVKGIICRQLYGEYSCHRPSGDEDVLIPKKDFFQAKQILESQGFVAEELSVTEKDLDEIQELTFTNPQTGLEIELHVNLMGTSTSWHKQMNMLFDNVWENFNDILVNDTLIRTMNHTDFYLFLILHALKHFTCGGFGFRQVSDILLYEKTYTPEIDWHKIDNSLELVNGSRFFSDLHQLGNQYLGFSLPLRGEVTCSECMFEDMMNSGAFGNDRQSNSTAVSMTQAALASINGKGQSKFSVLLRTAFPSKAYMEERNQTILSNNYELCRAWVQRWLKFLNDSKHTDEHLAMESMKISQHRIKLLHEYKIF